MIPQSQKCPAPDYIVICSRAQEWKEQADLVAKLGKSMLLIGAEDGEAFIEELRLKHGLSRENLCGDQVLLWNAANV